MHGKAGMESEEGTAFLSFFLGASRVSNALSNEADIAKVQEWLGHANVSTTRLYDRRAFAV